MNKVKLNVTEEMLERVVFGMENQKDCLMLDPENGQLRPEKENDGSFIPLPAWGPTDGYRLMDGFASSLPDIIFRKRLLDILHSGTGVFRNFKDALKGRPELEGLWRRYKKKEMRRTALSWLSRWSEALALEALGPEPEDWEQLSPAEFVIRKIRKDEWPQILDWNKIAEVENSSDLTPGESGEVLVAEGPSGEIVGYSRMILDSESGCLEGRLDQVFVLPELRGLGIGRMLTEASLKQAEEKGAAALTVKTGVSSRIMEKYLENSGFTPVTTLWRKKL
ncbi:MAG: hypothetical protein DRZ90_11535 [Spirochaetes bacterium]|nr:MAG: hypothetical protein DRZ90_11535 [Spirochaetota bacterium]